MRALARTALRTFDRANQALNALGTSWVLAVMALVNADVLSRALFNRPIAGTREIIEMSVVGIVYLQLAWALRCGRMTRSTLLADTLARRAPRAGHLLEVAVALAGAAFMLAIAWRTWPELVTAWTRNRFHGTRGVFTLPLWPFTAIILTGTLVAAAQYLLFALQSAAAGLGRGGGPGAARHAHP